MLRKGTTDVKKVQSKILEMKNISLLKNTVDRIYIRLNTAEEKINEPEDMAIETIQNETQREKTK